DGVSSGSIPADVVPAPNSPDGCTPTQKKQPSNGAKTTAAKTHTSRRLTMPDQPYKPSTEVIREAYIGEPPYALYRYTEEEFDHWLSTVEAAAEQRGAERALREAAKEWRWSAWADAPRNPIAAANYTGDWIENRADQMEGDDE